MCVCMTLFSGTCVTPALGTLPYYFLPHLLLLFCPLLHVGHNLIILSVQPAGIFGRRPLGQATGLWYKK